MTSSNKRLAHKAVAVVVIVALLDLVGVAPSVMLFVTAVIAVVWFISRRSQDRELESILQFYVAADAILREEDRRWFAFELADVIDRGESALHRMSDPPPLQLFALGALYQRIGNHEATVEYLSRVEHEEYAEEYRVAPSPQLRRYVSLLRELEKDPASAPLVVGAVRNLERCRRRSCARMLAESQSFLKNGDVSEVEAAGLETGRNESAPPPILEVLQDVYPEDSGTVS